MSGVGDFPIETARANCSVACGRLAALLQRAQSLLRQITYFRRVNNFAPILYLVQCSLLMAICDRSYIDWERDDRSDCTIMRDKFENNSSIDSLTSHVGARFRWITILVFVINSVVGQQLTGAVVVVV